MENISKYIVTVNLTQNTEIKNNSEIIINNIKILIKISEDVNKEIHITKNNIHSIDYYDSNNELKTLLKHYEILFNPHYEGGRPNSQG